MRENDTLDEEFIWDTIDLDEASDTPNLLDDTDELFPENINDALVDDERDSERKFKKSRLKTFRHRFKLIIAIIVLLLIGSIFIPIIPINTTSYNETNFVSSEQLKEDNPIKDNSKISLFDLVKVQMSMRNKTKLNLDVNYDWKNHNLSVVVNEEIPIARSGKTTYYRLKNKIHTSNDFPYQAPELIGFDQKQTDQIVEQLGYLNYNVIKEISNITLQASNEEPNLVVLTMRDGNYVFINIDQISNKMPYYNQMVSVVKTMKGPESRGIFHLDYGDYYEQI